MSNKMKSVAILLTAVAVMIFLPPAMAELRQHAPIRIIGNEGFTPDNGVVAGTGTEADPYIIENWIISNPSGSGI
jgi:hypothetical protein